MPFTLAKAGNIWRWLSPGGLQRLAFEVLRLGERVALETEDVERRLVEHHADRS